MHLPISAPKTLVDGKSVIVLGAGMVGTCAALELQKRGARVTLIDRKEPGCETSYGNAGVFARSSLFPLNNPGLLGDLPKLLSNKNASLRYDWRFVLANLSWTARFLLSARPSVFRETTQALDELIQLSIAGHKALISQSGQDHLLSERGWIFLYRSLDRFEKAALQRKTLQDFGVDAQILDGAELRALEPSLNPIFPRSLWIKDSYSVNDPGALVKAYTQLFCRRGGVFERAEIQTVSQDGHRATIRFKNDSTRQADHLVVCLGPWSKTLMQKSGYKVQMGFERGYHAHFTGVQDGETKPLSRPICDTGGSYVLSPMNEGLRLCSGVELKDCESAPTPVQLNQVELSARDAINLGQRIEKQAWLGSRPTFPDSRPAIGLAPGAKHVSVAFGHQHIGLATGPGTALILADSIEGKTPPVDARPFRPERFIRHRR